MPRKNPSKKIDLIGKPDSIPEFDVTKFIESCLSSGLYRFIKTPTWDSVGDSLEDFYLSARTEHNFRMGEKAELVEHQRLQNLSNKSRLYHLNLAQAELRNRFVMVNIFLRDFTDKRKSAIKRAEEELALQQEIRASNDKIKRDLNELVEFRKRIKVTTDEYEPYERVLEEVVRESPAFSSVKELMDRCDALMLAQVEISELSAFKINELEIMRKRLVDVANKAALQILGLKNTLANLDHVYQAACNECLKWEKRYMQAKGATARKMVIKESARGGLDHIYRLLCLRRSINPDLRYEEIEERLDFIMNEVETLRDVLEEIGEKGEEPEDTKPGLMC